MIKNIKAIFFEVDGTLLSHRSNDVPLGTRKSLARLRAQGIKTVIAAGRHKIELEKLPVNDLDFDGYLTLNGDLLLDECAVTSWNDTGIDIIPKNGGKVAGIRRFMLQHGIAQSEIMAFGDGENDIQMLKFAGVGIAMGNADDEVKAAADYVTDSVDENGIEKALRHFHLID